MAAEHHFTLAYCPWSNGAVERVNREVIGLIRALVMEHNLLHNNRLGKLKESDWPYLLPIVMGAINSSPSVRLADKSPREVFMGLDQFNPVHLIYAPHLKHIQDIPVDGDIIREKVARLKEHLDSLHARVDVSTERKRKANRKQLLRRHRTDPRFKRHNKRRRDTDDLDMVDDVDLIVDFQVGDMVMVAVPERPSSHKLQAKWRGPYQVVRTINDSVYEVQHLVTHKLTEAHIRRIKFSCDAELDIVVQLTDHISQQETSCYEVEDICAWQYNDEAMQHEVQVKWLGFSEHENTWENIETMHEDVPALVLRYIEERCSREDQRTLKTELGLL